MCQNWERCEGRLADSTLAVKDLKTRLNQSVSTSFNEPPSEERFYQVENDFVAEPYH